MDLEIAQLNRLGNRDKNEDRLVVVERGKTILIAVADGMGGHSGGEIAAQIVVDTLERLFRLCELPLHDPKGFLKNAISSAHTLINREAKNHKPAIDPRTTCVACLLQGSSATWAHVGDSRLYLIRDQKIITRTIDHSYVEDLFRQGAISESDMLTHPKRSYLTQCVGGNSQRPEVRIDAFDDLAKNDVVLLCSDGLWSAIDEQLILDMSEHSDLEQAVNQITLAAESNTYPQSDNVSVIVARVRSLTSVDTPTEHNSDVDESGNIKDHLNHAVDTINQALEDYSNEMDYDPGTK